MLTIKGFVQIKPYIDNEPGEVSDVGELSTYSHTFSRHKGYYYSEDHPDYGLITFTCNDDGTEEKLDVEFKRRLFTLIDWVYTNAENKVFNDESSTFVDTILAELSDSDFGDVKDVYAGEMIDYKTDVFIPQFVRFSLDHDDIEREHTIQLWFADEPFRAQYDEYEIVVVPPLDPIDDLIDEPNVVGDRLDEISVSERQRWIEDAKDYHPPTSVRVESYLWKYPDSDEGESEHQTHWVALIYGEAGDNIDAVSKAFKDYTEENSDYDLEKWEEYVPDLFRLTEFTILPLWDQYSVENETVEAGLYSPIVNISRAIKLLKQLITLYGDRDYIEEAIETTALTYKSLSLAVVASPENREAISSLSEMFSDYIVVPTTSVEYDRMSEYTRDWLKSLLELVRAAETMTPEVLSDIEVTRMYRDDRDGNEHLYAVRTYDDVQFLVLTRYSYEKLVEKTLD